MLELNDQDTLTYHKPSILFIRGFEGYEVNWKHSDRSHFGRVHIPREQITLDVNRGVALFAYKIYIYEEERVSALIFTINEIAKTHNELYHKNILDFVVAMKSRSRPPCDWFHPVYLVPQLMFSIEESTGIFFEILDIQPRPLATWTTEACPPVQV